MPHLIAPWAMAVSLLAMAAFPGHAAPPPGDPLAAFRDKARVLVVLAPDSSDPKLEEQRALFAAMQAGADERDLALVVATGNDPRALALRRRFRLGADTFQAILVGKDGGDKLMSAEPIGADRLFSLIDAMPMRQHEMLSR